MWSIKSGRKVERGQGWGASGVPKVWGSKVLRVGEGGKTARVGVSEYQGWRVDKESCKVGGECSAKSGRGREISQSGG